MDIESTETAPVYAHFIKNIPFHGINLAVLNASGVDYIPARPLCDLAGLDWKGAKRTLQSPDKVYLYSLKRLIPPHIEGFGGLKSPQEGVLCLRLDCSRMYLAQISTERMRANGNHEGANQVLAQYQHQTRALAWWQQCGLEEISEPGITERRWQRRQSKPTMIQALELIDELSERGRYSGHNHSHSVHCRCSRLGNHTHGPF